MSLETETFVKGLVELVPALEPLYREHLSDNDELLPHVFMGDVTRFVESRAREQADSQDLQIILNRLEAGLRSSDDVRDLVFASFLETF